jgi:hypothetical protein
MVLIGKAATRPPEIWYFYLLERLYNVQPDTVFFSYLHRIGHPKAIVNAATQMFRKMPVNMTTDGVRPASVFFYGKRNRLCKNRDR